MGYITKAGNIAADLEERKLIQRLELCKLISRRGAILELFAGRGNLSVVYRDFCSKIILVDENRSYLDEAEGKLNNFPHEVFCKDNLDFIRDDLPTINCDITLVDFDAFGTPAAQIQTFFANFKVRKPLIVAMTDGLGLRWGWVCIDYNNFQRYAQRYFVKRIRRIHKRKWQVSPLRRVHVSRDFVKFFDDLLMMQIAKKYCYNIIKVNEFVRRHGFPVYLGYQVSL